MEELIAQYPKTFAAILFTVVSALFGLVAYMWRRVEKRLDDAFTLFGGHEKRLDDLETKNAAIRGEHDMAMKLSQCPLNKAEAVLEQCPLNLITR